MEKEQKAKRNLIQHEFLSLLLSLTHSFTLFLCGVIDAHKLHLLLPSKYKHMATLLEI